jgi:hypothetical protein
MAQGLLRDARQNKKLPPPKKLRCLGEGALWPAIRDTTPLTKCNKRYNVLINVVFRCVRVTILVIERQYVWRATRDATPLTKSNKRGNVLINVISRRVRVTIIVVERQCVLLSLLYCSNSCTSLRFKTLKSHTKTLKIRRYMFRSTLKPSSGGPRPYFARLLNWNVDLHLL